MSMSIRKFIAAISAIILGVLLAIGMFYMPAADDEIAAYGLLLADLSVDERNSMNTVSGVLFDLRALDTLGELIALFTVSAGMNIILRKVSKEKFRDKRLLSRKSRPAVKVSDTIRSLCLALAAPMAMYGLYICVRGHLTIGGGFQGGVIIASALILIYLAGFFNVQEKIAHNVILNLTESIGMGGVLIAGLVGLFLTGSLFGNILPLGSPGDFFSGGMIPILSVLVGFEAAAALALIVSHLQSQLLELEEKP